MDINQNIICIKTAMKMCSGIIYPCEIRNERFDDTSFIIFTNRHAVSDLPKENEKLIQLVDFIIYDKKGNLINIPKTKDVELHLFYEEDGNEVEDIAAFHLTFHYRIDIDLENRVLWDESDFNELFVEGFPQILSDNQISSKMQLQGKNKPIFPKNNKIGVFQITDDYHWYSNYKDMRLFQGFSGSPIYMKTEKKNILVGMNQSVLNVGDGENPFKLLYYYKFRYILEYLRKRECIIFRRNEDYSVSVRWIYNETKTNQNNINLLVLGASGAGKSSFAKTFLLHSDLINSTNDGQTTRFNIIYEVKVKLCDVDYNCGIRAREKPKAYIKFLNKDDFMKRMIQLNYLNYLCKIMSIIYKNISISSPEECIKYAYFKLLNESDGDSKSVDKKKTIKNKIEEIFMDFEKKSYKSNHDYYGKTCDVLEDILENEDFSKVLENNKIEIDNILLNIEGFFSESEFDFLFLEGDIKPTFAGNDKFQEYFKKFYEEVHEKIKEKLLQKKIVKENNLSHEIYFDKQDEVRDLLPLCLQVVGNKSLTGVIDYVKIIDYVSNDYSFIFDDLNIGTLRLIDTYGLDHASWDENKGQVLSNIVYDLVEKRMICFDSNLAVTYVKKLDSGKPTEIKSIIPQIYNFIPQSPVYCIFNGLDIFLGKEIEQFTDCESFYLTVNKPKAIMYLESEDGKKEILSKFDKNKEFANNLFATLKNNIVSFCGDSAKWNETFKLYDSNRKQIYKLLLSICMKEYSSMNIIPQEIVDEINGNKYDDAIKEIIYEIFRKASRKNWENSHWKTSLANYTRIREMAELGYWGTYKHRWDQLFHIGYTRMVTEKEKDFLGTESEKGWVLALDSCIKNMEYMFIGSVDQLIYFAEKKFWDNKKNKFRELIERMYNEGVEEKIYSTNPFSGKQGNNDRNDIDYLNDICNFEKGVKLIEADLLVHFKETLVECIKKENKAKKENLKKINYDFYIEYQKLKYEFNKKYEDIDFDELYGSSSI